MKKLIYFAVALTLLSFGVASCNKYLDQAPDGKISLEDVWSDYDKTMYYLNNCYASLPQKGVRYFFWERGPVVWCDDAYDGDDLDVNWAPSARLYNGDASANSHPIIDAAGLMDHPEGNYWSKYFARIRNCAMFIKYADPEIVGSTSEYNRWIAEAKLLRAYYYAELLSWFGCGLPLIDEPYSYTDDFSQVTRASYYEVVKFIIKDCDDALACAELPWRITSGSEAFRVTKALACAIKSRMSVFAASPLYNEGQNHWAEAASINKQALADLEAHGYELYNKVNIPATWGHANAHLPNTYAQLYNEYFCNSMAWSDAPADKETIYQLPGGGNVAHIDCMGAMMGYKTGTCPTQELVDAYETDNGETVLDLSKPYLDEETHLKPNYNTANKVYNPQDPYAHRDPRFYATIYYNGSKRYCSWGSAAGSISFENKGQQSGYYGTRTIATWARWEKNGEIHEQPEPNTGWKLTDRTPTRSGYFERKFAHPNSGNNLQPGAAYHKDYRLAEVILNYAEAAFESGDEATARQMMNRVRARVGMPAVPASVTGEALRQRIHNERRVEFALEGQRYFDVRRWHKPGEDLRTTDHYKTAAYITCHVDANNNVTGYTYDRTTIHELQCYTSKYLTVAIPLTEVNNMKAVTGENWQNPGWE